MSYNKPYISNGGTEEKMAILKEKDDDDANNTKRATQYLSIDEILDQIGQIGKYQILVMILFSTLFVVPACQALIIVFIADSPPWKCASVKTVECNTTEIFLTTHPEFDSRCKMNRSSWAYTLPKSYSIVTQFDLVCSSNTLAHVASSGLFIGQIFGCILISWISDRYGRKKALLPSFTLLVCIAFISSFSPNIWFFITMRVLAGIFHGGILSTAVVMSIELVGPKHRALAGIIIWNSWTVAICFMSLQSWLINNWKHLSMVLTAPYILILSGLIFLPESTRWLRSQNKLQNAEKILKTVAKVNKKPFPINASIEPPNRNISKLNSTYKDLVTPFTRLWKTFSFCVMWFCNDMLYYGISMISGDLGGSLHRDFVLISLVEIPANLSTIYIANKIGRKKSTLLGYIGASLTLLTFGFLEIFGVRIIVLRIVLGIFGKSFGLLSWCAVEVWSSEHYPTSVRAQAIGLFYILSQVGAAVSPWVTQWVKHFNSSLPFFIMGGLPVITFLMACTLAETKGTQMTDFFETEEDVGLNKLEVKSNTSVV